MLKAIIIWACGILVVLVVVRSAAPTVHQWFSRWGTVTERVTAARDMQRQFPGVSIEEIVASPPGALVAATVCQDEALRKRAEKAWVAERKDGPNGAGHLFAAKIASEVIQAGVVDMRLSTILKMDCPKAIRLATRTVAKY